MAVIRPVARSRAKAGREMVPIPCVPSSAICYWAGEEQREEYKSPVLLSPTRTTQSSGTLCSFHVWQSLYSFLKHFKLINNNQSEIVKFQTCYRCPFTQYNLWCSSCCTGFLNFLRIGVWLWTEVVVTSFSAKTPSYVISWLLLHIQREKGWREDEKRGSSCMCALFRMMPTCICHIRNHMHMLFLRHSLINIYMIWYLRCIRCTICGSNNIKGFETSSFNNLTTMEHKINMINCQ